MLKLVVKFTLCFHSHLLLNSSNCTPELPTGVSHRLNTLQVTHDISHLSCADVFRAPGVQTPVIVRFSTVIHERGSPETLRDPRGFAVKFYTREGNWDLVYAPF